MRELRPTVNIIEDCVDIQVIEDGLTEERFGYTPEQARGLAAALIHYAFQVENQGSAYATSWSGIAKNAASPETMSVP